MRWTKAGLAMGLALTAAGAARAQFSVANPHAGVSLYVWNQDLSGTIGGTTGGANGSGTLQEDGDSTVGLTLNWGKWELGYTRLDNTATGTVNSTFTFDGQTYTAGQTFRLEEEIGMFDLFRRFTLASTESTTVHAMFGFKVLDLKMDARTTSGPAVRGTLDETAPLPMIGIAGRFGPRTGLAGFAGIRYFGLEVGDVDASVGDISLGLDYRSDAGFHAALGWRSFEIDAKFNEGNVDSGKVDLENDGLFFEVGMKF